MVARTIDPLVGAMVVGCKWESKKYFNLNAIGDGEVEKCKSIAVGLSLFSAISMPGST